MHADSDAWKLYSYVSFIVALGMMILGIVFAPIDLSLKAYLSMGTFFLTGTCFTLAKTLRDNHEGGKLHNKIEAAQTERILKEYQRAAWSWCLYPGRYQPTQQDFRKMSARFSVKILLKQRAKQTLSLAKPKKSA